MLFWFSLVPRPSQYSNGRWQRLKSCWILSHDTHLMFVFVFLWDQISLAESDIFYSLLSSTPLLHHLSTPTIHNPRQKERLEHISFHLFLPRTLAAGMMYTSQEGSEDHVKLLDVKETLQYEQSDYCDKIFHSLQPGKPNDRNALEGLSTPQFFYQAGKPLAFPLEF